MGKQTLLILPLSLLLIGCSKGGSARFLEEALGTWNAGKTNPSVQVGIGGGHLVQSGHTASTGYTAQVILKAENASTHTGGSHTMTINSVKSR